MGFHATAASKQKSFFYHLARGYLKSLAASRLAPKWNLVDFLRSRHLIAQGFALDSGVCWDNADAKI
jgi:hypothetical protein